MDLLRRRYPIILLSSIFIFFALTALLSEGYFGGADNVSHYFISRFAFRYPHLFLDSWGRPLYTVLSAPFALAGLPGAKLLNVLLGTATAWMAYLIVRDERFRQPAGILLFVCFTPLYFVMIPTVLTEILFSFLLTLSMWLFARQKFMAFALVISLLPFARSEGYLLLPVYLALLVWKRQYSAIPLLFTGILMLSLAGSFYYKDILWLVHQFPYPVTSAHDIYTAKGNLWHFFQAWRVILGIPLSILLIAGLVFLFRDLRATGRRERVFPQNILLTGFMPAALYFSLHSILYWRGLGGSVGLERVMAAILPPVAIVAYCGYEGILSAIRKFNLITTGFSILVFISLIVVPLLIWPFPYPLSPEERAIRSATGYLRISPYADHVVFYTDRNVPYYLGLDPFRKDPAECVAFGDHRFLDTIPEGSVLIWDAHFGANESKLPLDSVLDNRNLQAIACFAPEEPWITLGGGFYECTIFISGRQETGFDNFAFRDSVQMTWFPNGFYRTLFLNTFERTGDGDPAKIMQDQVWSGKASYLMDRHTEFSPGFYQTVSSLDQLSDSLMFRVSVRVFLPSCDSIRQAQLVLSVEREGKPYEYHSVMIRQAPCSSGRWQRIRLSAPFPGEAAGNDIIKAYVWNRAGETFFMDDLRVAVCKAKPGRPDVQIIP